MLDFRCHRAGSRAVHLGAAGRIRLALSVAAALTLNGLPAQAQILDTRPWVPNGEVRAIVSDGHTVYIGGKFTVVGPLTGGGARVRAATGGIAHPSPIVSGNVVVVVADGSGGWYIGGRFTAIGGIPRLNLAHVLADGSVSGWDPSPTGTNNPEGADAEGYVGALAVSGSTVYVSGDFTTIGGAAREGLAAVDAVTGAATPWNPNPPGYDKPLAVSGNTVYVGGVALDATTGALLWDAAPSGSLGLTALAVSGNTLYAAGYFSAIGGQPRNYIAALDASTGLATTWNPNANRPVRALAVSGNTVYAAGVWSLSQIGGAPRNCIAALDATTGAATAWNPGADGTVLSLAVSGNTVYAGGYFTHIGGQDRLYLAALNATTGTATGWNPTPGGETNGTGGVFALATSGDEVYVGGSFSSIGGQLRGRIAALDAATGALTSWNPGALGGSFPYVDALARSGATIYVGGSFTSVGGQVRNRIAALDATTGATTAWNPNADAQVGALVVAGNTVYAGGSFTAIGGQNRIGIAALDAATGIATDWNPGENGGSMALAVNGNTIYAAGEFNSIGGQPRNNIAALDAVSGSATAWDPNANYSVHALAVSGNTVYAGGHFTSIGGQARNKLAALDASTGVAAAWNPNAGSLVNAIAVSGNTVYVGGQFPTIGGQPRSCLAAVDAGTGTVSPWDPDADSPVYALAAVEAHLHVGGAFTTIGGLAQAFFAAFETDAPTPVLVSLAGVQVFSDRVELAWEVGGNASGAVTVYRAETVGQWWAVGTSLPDGEGRVGFMDRDVTAGRRYGYRLGLIEGGQEVFDGETWIEVPALAFALHGARSNPGGRLLSTTITLPMTASATLELVDVTGRRLLEREVGTLGAGTHRVEMTPDRPLAAGVYWLRLTQGASAALAKVAVLQ